MIHQVIIIAEAGVNHNGDISIAKELIVAAAKAGADFVKFQTFNADLLVSKATKKANYQAVNINDNDDSQYNMLKKLEIPEYWYPELIRCAHEHNISFLSTGFDESSIDFLEQWDPLLIKIPSGEITNRPYLQHVAKKGKHVVMSTGMATMEEVIRAVETMKGEGLSKDKITVLHCNTEYPTPYEDVNLFAMIHIKETLDINVGYSDHTLGIEIPIAAVTLGAKVIEKHFTLDRSMSGPDHAASLVPTELAAMVKAIKNTNLALSGSGIKEPSNSEQKNIALARKSIHTRTDLMKGHCIEQTDLVMLRPGDGISPMDLDHIIGKKLVRSLQKNEKISISDLNEYGTRQR